MSLIRNYAKYLPKFSAHNILSLGEGSTPLIELSNLTEYLNTNCKIYAKFEGVNPTGSFKDRGMCVAMSHAKQQGHKLAICASTGNTSASCAAYAAKARMSSVILIPDGKIAFGKLAQALVHGAKIIKIKGNFDDAMQMVKQLAQNLPIALVNSVNPYRIMGQKTAAMEIVDELKQAPDYHCLPVGNAGNITAYWQGFLQYNQDLGSNLPKMLGFQAKNAAPFIKGEPIDCPETIATAIRIGNPQSWDGAIQAVNKSNGWFGSISDDMILETQGMLARLEGIFCEPASAISVAGLIDAIKSNQIKDHSVVTCTLTGHGLKDPNIVLDNINSFSQDLAQDICEPNLNQLTKKINDLIAQTQDTTTYSM